MSSKLQNGTVNTRESLVNRIAFGAELSFFISHHFLHDSNKLISVPNGLWSIWGALIDITDLIVGLPAMQDMTCE